MPKNNKYNSRQNKKNFKQKLFFFIVFTFVILTVGIGLLYEIFINNKLNQAEQFASGISSEYEIVWSPDKQTFFYLDKQEVSYPSGVPSDADAFGVGGRYGTITLIGDPKIMVFDSKKEKIVPVAKPEFKDFFNENYLPFWLNDSNIVLTVSSFENEDPEFQGIWVYSIISGDSTRLVNEPICPNDRAYVSSDKKYMTFCVGRIGTGKVGIIDFSSNKIDYLPTYSNAISFSPNNQFMAYQDSSSVEYRGLWIRNLNTRESIRLIGTDDMFGTRFNNIIWSPDSKSISFTRDVYWGNTAPDPITPDVIKEESLVGEWIIKIDGSDLKKIN